MTQHFDPIQFAAHLALERWQQHSTQRLSLFTAYVAGFVALIAISGGLFELKALLLVAPTAIFWLLDRRIRELVKNDEFILMQIEEAYVPEEFRVLARDARTSRETTYSRIFSYTYGIVLIGVVVSLTLHILRLL